MSFPLLSLLFILWDSNLIKFGVVSHCFSKHSCFQSIFCVKLCSAFICPAILQQFWELRCLLNKPESFTDNSFGHQSDNSTSWPGGPCVSRQKSHRFSASQTSLCGQARTSDILHHKFYFAMFFLTVHYFYLNS